MTLTIAETPAHIQERQADEQAQSAIRPTISRYFEVGTEKAEKLDESIAGTKNIPQIQPEEFDLRTGQPESRQHIDKLFPLEIMNGALTNSCLQFLQNWGIDPTSDQGRKVATTFKRAMVNQITAAFQRPSLSDQTSLPTARFALNQESEREHYKNWYVNLPPAIAYTTWLEHIAEEEHENEQTIKERVERLQETFQSAYEIAKPGDNSKTTSSYHISSLIELSRGSLNSSQIEQKNRQVLQDMDLLVRLANITWFSTQYARAYVEKNPDRINPDKKPNLRDFDSMVAKMTEIGEQSENQLRVQDEISKDMWGILSYWGQEWTTDLNPPW